MSGAVPIAAGLLMAALCGYLGNYVVLKRLSFFADTLGHSALLGIGLGALLHLTPQSTLIPFSVLLALAMTWLLGRSSENAVAVTAVVFSVCLGGGVILLSRAGTGGEELEELLFGELSRVGVADLVAIAVVGAPTALFLASRNRQLCLSFLDVDLAQADGIPVRRLEYAFMFLLGLLIAVCIRLTGVLLVTALITLPPLIAARWAKSFRGQLLGSTASGIACAAIGMLLSIRGGIPAGPAIAVVAGAAFLLAPAQPR